jgi:hypothetical protein
LENYVLHVYNDTSVDEGLLHFAAAFDTGILAFATHQQSRLLSVLIPGSKLHLIHQITQPVWTYNPAVGERE